MLEDGKPWQEYADASRGAHFARWAETHCIQSTDRFAGLPLELESWQRAIVDEMLAESGDPESGYGSYWHHTGLIVPKGNGKSSLLSAFSLYELVENDGAPEVLLAAATDKQAGHLFNSAVRFVKSSPWLTARLVVREHVGQIARVDGFGVLHRISGDSAAAGFNPSLVVIDELADWSTPRRQGTYADLVTAGQVKRGSARVVFISTAGEPYERIDGILGRMLDANERDGELEKPHAALTISRNHSARALIFNYSAPTDDPADTDALKLANPASWITRERLAELAQSPALTPGRFLQLHACRWASSAGPLVTFEEWRDAQVDERLNGGDEVVLGVRGGRGWSLVACRRQDGVLFVLGAGDPGMEDERDRADRILRAALASYRVSAVFAAATAEWLSLVDAWRLELGRKRVVEVRVDLHGSRTAQIVERWLADFANGEIRHTGDPRLSASILAARLAVDGRGRTYVTDDLEHRVPTTATLAAVLAWEAAMTSLPDPPPRKIDVSDYRIVPLY